MAADVWLKRAGEVRLEIAKDEFTRAVDAAFTKAREHIELGEAAILEQVI